jgi:DMSO reductase anchor subunit
MHPAYSVIFFTSAAGAGYGLLALLALFVATGLVPATPMLGFVGLGLALALITAGLLSSTAHLGHPERAWRAVSQWRSSWLSREGIAALATYVPAAVLGMGWVVYGAVSITAAIATAVLALITVWCTGMIYQSLPTIRAWNQAIVTPIYLALSLATGAVLLHLLLAAFGLPARTAGALGLIALIITGLLKAAYWARIDGASKTYTVESATGLGRFGKVRSLEPAHAQANYVMREMGYRIARKHVAKLRRLVLATLVVVPSALLAAAWLSGGALALVFGLLATASAAAGIMVERWLFFAEAEHVVMLYYGRDTA